MLRHPFKLVTVLTVLTLLTLPHVATAQNLIVGLYFNNRAYKFASDGTNLGEFASTNATSRFYDMTFDTSGSLFVAGAFSNNIRRFSPTGVDQGDFVTLSSPSGVAFDSNGNLYVSSFANNTVL